MKLSLLIPACLLSVLCHAQNDRPEIVLDNVTPKEFVAAVKADAVERTGGNYIPVVTRTKQGAWITEKDIPFLLKLIRSEEKCRCIVNPLSVRMPPKEQYATLGGIVMDMLDHYRNKTPFPFKTMVKLEDGADYPAWYRCPRTDAARVKEITTWGEKVKK